jgi:macrocin-O-methyltransferase TylF-like protien
MAVWRQRVVDLSNKPALRAIKPAMRATQVLPRRTELPDLRAWRRQAVLHRRMRRSGHTLLSSRHGRDLVRLAEDVDSRAIPGQLVDCGVWNGGSAMLLASGAPNREVWAFDSFEGLPEPTEGDPEHASDWIGEFVGSEAMLRQGFRDYGLTNPLHIVAGWFEETLPATAEQVKPIAVLHVDADLYQSVRIALRTFYPKLSPGGWVAVDDYRMWEGTRLAVDEYRREMEIEAPIVDHHYWEKPPTVD